MLKKSATTSAVTNGSKDSAMSSSPSLSLPDEIESQKNAINVEWLATKLNAVSPG
jgi:hypothetical protein